MNKMAFSSIDEPIALTGKIYHKDSLLTSRPYLMLCLPISIDDCSYIYNKLSKMVNYTLDPNAPLYLGHLAIAAINGEALLIILTSKADLTNPSFIHFKNVSFISGDDRKYSIKINSEHSDQNYEFTCKGGVDYDKWLYYLNQSHKITNGEVGRKLRFCSLLFNKESNNRDIKVSKDNISPIRKMQNDSYNSSTLSNSISNTSKFDDIEPIENIPKPSRHPALLLGNNPDDSFSNNYLCSEKFIENYNKEKENELKAAKMKALENKESSETLLNDTHIKEDKIQKKTSQSFNPDIDDLTQVNYDNSKSYIASTTVSEDEKPLGQLMQHEIIYDNKTNYPKETSNIMTSTNTINKASSLPNNSNGNELNEITPVNYGAMNSNHKINVMNQPIINNNINVINSAIPGFNPLLNNATGSTFNPSQGISYSTIQLGESSNSLINSNTKMSNNSLNMGFNNNPIANPLPVLTPLQIPPQPSTQSPVPYDLPRQPVFYNPSPTSNPNVYNDINKALYNKKGANPSTPHSIPRIPAFYNPSSPVVPSSPIDLNKPNTPTSIEPSSPHSLPRHSVFYKQSSVSNSRNNVVNSYPNLNKPEINTSPNKLANYPPLYQKSSTSPASPSSSTSSTRFNRQYEEQNRSLPRPTKKAEQPKKKFQSLPRYNSYKVTITRFKSIFSNSKNKDNENTNFRHEKHNSVM